MSEEVKPEVGDVWQLNAGPHKKIKITAIGVTKCLYMAADQEYETTIYGLNENYKLIERDGKPYKPKRVFEESAFYPVIDNNAKFFLLLHSNGHFYSQLSPGSYRENDLSWIGEKLEIEWPEVEND